MLVCYIQNKGKRKERNVTYVHIKFREVFGLVISGLLVLIIGFMEQNSVQNTHQVNVIYLQ